MVHPIVNLHWQIQMQFCEQKLIFRLLHLALLSHTQEQHMQQHNISALLQASLRTKITAN